MTPSRCTIAIAAVVLLSAGCQKKVQAARPAIVLPKSEPKQEAPPPLPAAPKIEGQTETPAPPVLVEVKPPPPAKPVVTKRPRKNAASKKADIKAEARPPEVKIEPKPETPIAKPDAVDSPPKPTLPVIGEILSEDQSRDYTRRLETALVRSKEALVIIESKTLNAAQKQTAGRIRGFIAQAEQGRVQDLANATSLAERADLLAKDLLVRLR